jgi:putative DNA primase/helicase
VGQHDELRQRAAYEAQQLWKISQIITGEATPEPDFDPGPKAQLISASAIAPERIEWLWPGRIPLGMLALFSGDPKLGKSLAALSLIAAVTRGGALPGSGADGPGMAPLGSAILLSAEDDWARTIVPRLLAAGADLDRVKFLSTMHEPEFRGFSGPTAHVPARERMPTLSVVDLQAIERSAAALGDCRLIVFDPVSAYLGRNADVRRALTPLKEMARRLNATVLLITHHNKRGASGTNGKYRVLGDVGSVAICRANFMFLEDPDDPTGQRRLMLDNGRNLGPKLPGLPYVVREEGAAPIADWLPETIDLDADAALALAAKAAKTGASGRLARHHACEQWLRGYLADGPKPVKECERGATMAGFNPSLVNRARATLRIRTFRSGFGQGSCCYIDLPEAGGEPPHRPDCIAGDHTPPYSPPNSRGEYEEYGEYGAPRSHTPPYSPPNSRGEYEEYGEYGAPIEPAPHADRAWGTEAAAAGDGVASGG